MLSFPVLGGIRCGTMTACNQEGEVREDSDDGRVAAGAYRFCPDVARRTGSFTMRRRAKGNGPT